jgi:hypothetical protein
MFVTCQLMAFAATTPSSRKFVIRSIPISDCSGQVASVKQSGVCDGRREVLLFWRKDLSACIIYSTKITTTIYYTQFREVIRSTPISDCSGQCEWHGSGRVMAWERHGMCESVFKTAGERHGMCESAFSHLRAFTRCCSPSPRQLAQQQRTSLSRKSSITLETYKIIAVCLFIYYVTALWTNLQRRLLEWWGTTVRMVNWPQDDKWRVLGKRSIVALRDNSWDDKWRQLGW